MKNQPYNTNRHSCFILEYHLVVVTRNRHDAITGDLKDRLIELTHEIIEGDWGCTISSVNTDKDHVHILFEAKPQVQLSKLANNYKTVTSRLLRKEFSDKLADYYWKPTFWSSSYFICTVSERTHAAVDTYIKNQGR